MQWQSVTLENKGSVARDHLANERTFLAWLRTSLSFITIGIGITQLFRLQDPKKPSDPLRNFAKFGKPLGSVFIVLGITVLLLGGIRFFQVQELLVQGHYPAARKSVFFVIAVVGALIAITFVLVTIGS